MSSWARRPSRAYAYGFTKLFENRKKNMYKYNIRLRSNILNTWISCRFPSTQSVWYIVCLRGNMVYCSLFRSSTCMLCARGLIEPGGFRHTAANVIESLVSSNYSLTMWPQIDMYFTTRVLWAKSFFEKKKEKILQPYVEYVESK